MRIIKPTEKDSKIIPLPENLNKAIFLAGPCVRTFSKTKCDWRKEAIEYLKSKNFDGDVIDPTNEHYDSKEKDYLTKQVQWEWDGLHKSSAILFWFYRDKEHPAMTTNTEFGMWYNRDGVFIGCPEDVENNGYIKEIAKYYNKDTYSTLDKAIDAILKDLNRNEKKWFLSDTHLGAKRTLELSKRPFVDLDEMDRTIISNWNKLIRPNDTVIHLGDFGNMEYLKLLNFNRLIFVLGNYEKKDKPKVIKDLEDVARSKNIEVYNYKDYSDKPGIYIAERGSKFTLKDNTIVKLVHEPIKPELLKDDEPLKINYPYFKENTPKDLYLYGHIHSRSVYKFNGTDIGIDGNYFKPLDEDYVIWRLNAIKFLDDNIYYPICLK